MIIIEIGNNIKNARKDAGITQNELAQMLGVSRQSVSNWEKQSRISRHNQCNKNK